MPCFINNSNYKIDFFSNIVHGSDSEASAQREIALWFRPDEINQWPHTAEQWIYE